LKNITRSKSWAALINLNHGLSEERRSKTVKPEIEFQTNKEEMGKIVDQCRRRKKDFCYNGPYSKRQLEL